MSANEQPSATAISESSILRQQLRARRKDLSPDVHRKDSEQIAQLISRYLPYIRAKQIAVYASLPEEVDTRPLIAIAHEQNKQLYLPVLPGNNIRTPAMLFAHYQPDTTRMKVNRFGIPEPDVPIGECVRGDQLPLVCVPLVGYNGRCDRIGMGAGYYDRAFAKAGVKKTTLLGLAFSCQQADFDPAPHDVPMAAIATEAGIIERRPTSRQV